MFKINNTLRKLLICSTKRKLPTHFKQYSLYEPDYLESMKSKIPLYEAINIQIRGYDYPLLESFQKFIHNMISNMDINVEDAWAVPAQHMQIHTYKPNSDVINTQYKLRIYERTVQVTDISSPQLSVLLRALEASAPVGVTINVVPHEEYHEEIRYVPDSELNKLKQELEEMGGPLKKK